MQKLTHIQKEDGTYEGQVVDMQKACPTFKQINGGLFINQLIDYIEDGTSFNLYDSLIADLNINLAVEDKYSNSLDYIKREILPALDRMCPLNGIKFGTLIGKMIDKKQESGNEENPIELKSLTQKEIDGLNNTCFSLKVAKLGTIINLLISEIKGERVTSLNFRIPGVPNDVNSIQGVTIISDDSLPYVVEVKYLPNTALDINKDYNVSLSGNEEKFIVNKKADSKFEINVTENVEPGDSTTITISSTDEVSSDKKYTFDFTYNVSEEQQEGEQQEG